MDKPTKNSICPKKLPDLDSNQDIQIQNLLYYLYTIGQSLKPQIYKDLPK